MSKRWFYALAALLVVVSPAIEALPQEEDGSLLDARLIPILHGPVRLQAAIGDGAHGSGGTGFGDYDWYEIPDVNAGWHLSVDIDAQDYGSTLDSLVRVYDSTGTVVASNDDFSPPDTDSFLEFVAPSNGDYFVVVSSSGCAPQGDPFDPATGSCSGDTEGAYFVMFSLDAIGG